MVQRYSEILEWVDNVVCPSDSDAGSVRRHFKGRHHAALKTQMQIIDLQSEKEELCEVSR